MSSTVFYESASELATLTNSFSVSSVLTDPTTVSLAVTDPTGATTTYTYAASQITRTSTGVFTKDVACSLAGGWSAVWTGTGAASDVATASWEVYATTLGKLYVTPDILKSWLKITTTGDDQEIHQACFAASRWIEQYCERVFYRSASSSARTFESGDRYLLRLPEFSEIVSVSAVATDEAGDGLFSTMWASTDYQLGPYNAATFPETTPYTWVRAIAGRAFPYVLDNTRRDRTQITGVFGWPAVPSMVKQAALLQAVDALKTKETSFGVGGANEWGLVRIRENPIAMSYLNPYRRSPVLVG